MIGRDGKIIVLVGLGHTYVRDDATRNENYKPVAVALKQEGSGADPADYGFLTAAEKLVAADRSVFSILEVAPDRLFNAIPNVVQEQRLRDLPLGLHLNSELVHAQDNLVFGVGTAPNGTGRGQHAPELIHHSARPKLKHWNSVFRTS